MKSLVFSPLEISHIDKNRKTEVRFPYLYFASKEGFVPGMQRPKCPYGEAGDILMIKEAWRPAQCSSQFNEDDLELAANSLAFVPRSSSTSPFEYLSDVSPRFREEAGTWLDAESMPSVAVRYFVKVASVRMEHLHDISKASLIAEGMPTVDFENPRYTHLHAALYKANWEERFGEGSWDVNPVVWVMSFTNVAPPRSASRISIGQ